MSFATFVALLYILHCTSYSSIHSRGITIFGLKKQTFALWELYFRFRIWWHYCSLQKARIYQQTKFHSYNSIHGWDITISGLEKETTAILKFYFRFRFRLSPSACHSAPVYQISSRSDRPRQRNDVMLFSWWRISAILNFMSPIMGSLKSSCRTSYKSSIETIALNCLIFEKIAF